MKRILKKVLVHDDKHCSRIYDASTPKLEAEAWLKAFRYMNSEEAGEFYYDLAHPEPEDDKPYRTLAEAKDTPSDIKTRCQEQAERISDENHAFEQQRKQYLLARKGDADAAMKLLGMRTDYEYEHVHLEVVF